MKGINGLVLSIVDRFLVPLIVYTERRANEMIPVRTVQQELALRVVADSADYVQECMPTALQFGRREDLWDYAWSKISGAPLVAEFGVWNGYSINHFAKKTDKTIYGFDSFIGLQEEWTGAGHKGQFDVGGKLPQVAKNVRLIKGWFQDTLPPFLAEHTGTFAFIHVDCDTYEATQTVLNLLEPSIHEGTVIVFDDYFGYRGWQFGEHKAFQEFVARSHIRYEYMGYSTTQVAVVVKQRSGI